MSTVLITGGAGFIGSHVCAALAEDGHEVVVVDPLLTYAYTFEPRHWHSLQYRREVLLKDARVVVASTEGRDELRRVMHETKPDYVVHLGVLPLATVARVRADHAFESMLRGTFNLVDVALDMGLKKFLYVSSSMAYGDFTQTPMPETGITAPKDPYGGFKLAGEIILQTYSRAQGLPYAIVRPSAVYGPTDMNDRIVQRFVECARWSRPLTVVDPDNTVARLLVREGRCGRDGEGAALAGRRTRRSTSPRARAGRSPSCTTSSAQRYPDMPVEVSTKTDDFRPKRGALDIAKARELLGYEPRYSLERGVEEYLEFLVASAPGVTRRQSRELPYFALDREFEALREPIIARVEEVFRSGRLLQGPWIAELERELAHARRPQARGGRGLVLRCPLLRLRRARDTTGRRGVRSRLLLRGDGVVGAPHGRRAGVRRHRLELRARSRARRVAPLGSDEGARVRRPVRPHGRRGRARALRLRARPPARRGRGADARRRPRRAPGRIGGRSELLQLRPDEGRERAR